jgi:hypothetical protein
MANIYVHWVIACSTVGTPFSRRNPNPLSCNKVIRNIPLDVYLMEMIILKLGLKDFRSIY